MGIGSKLKSARLAKGYDQQYVCERLHIEQCTLSNYENERRSIKAEVVARLAQLYDISLDELFELNSKPQKKDTENTLDAYDQQIIDYCSSLDEEKKKAVLSYLQFLAQDKK